MTLDLLTPYQSRPVRFIDLWTVDGWRLKVYGISGRQASPPPAFVVAVKDHASGLLPRPAQTPDRYGVGFVGAHEGRDGSLYGFVDWWENENELRHHGLVAPGERPHDLEPVEPEGTRACVWDLAVIAFERQAWVDSVLANPEGAHLDRYLAARLYADL